MTSSDPFRRHGGASGGTNLSHPRLRLAAFLAAAAISVILGGAVLAGTAASPGDTTVVPWPAGNGNDRLPGSRGDSGKSLFSDPVGSFVNCGFEDDLSVGWTVAGPAERVTSCNPDEDYELWIHRELIGSNRYVEQTVEVADLDMVVSFGAALRGTNNGMYGYGQADAIIYFLDENHERLGQTAWRSPSSLVPASTATEHWRQAQTGYASYSVNLLQDLDEYLPGIDPGSVRYITLQFSLTGDRLDTSSDICADDISPCTSSVPALASPENGSLVHGLPEFCWLPFEGSAYYEICVSRDADLADRVWTADLYGDTCVVYGSTTLLEADTPYYWSARAATGEGWTSWANPWHFFKAPSGSPLTGPVLSAPEDAGGVALPELFSWFPVEGGDRYQMQIGPTDSLVSPVWQQFCFGDSIVVPASASMEMDSTYYWRTRAIDAAGNPGDWSEPWSFTRIAFVLPPNCPTLSLPDDESTVSAAAVVFAWSQAQDATSYDLQFSVEEDFPPDSDKTWEIDRITRTSYAARLSSATAPVWWRVRASNSGGTSPWSGVGHFYFDFVDSPITSVVIDRPLDGLSVEIGNRLQGHATVTGTHNGTLQGVWLVGSDTLSHFSSSMTAQGGAGVVSPALPTDSPGTALLSVHVQNPMEFSSSPVTYQVRQPIVGSPAALAISSQRTRLSTGGSDRSVLTVSVRDSLGHVCVDDDGRAIVLSVGGEGDLSSYAVDDTGGVAHVVYTAGSIPDTAFVVAEAGGLSGASVAIVSTSLELELLKKKAYAYMDRLENLMIDVLGYPLVWHYNLNEARSMVDNFAPGDEEALKRFILSLRVLDHVYYYDDNVCYGAQGITQLEGSESCVPGAEVMWDDAAVSTGRCLGAFLGALRDLKNLDRLALAADVTGSYRALVKPAVDGLFDCLVDWMDIAFRGMIDGSGAPPWQKNLCNTLWDFSKPIVATFVGRSTDEVADVIAATVARLGVDKYALGLHVDFTRDDVEWSTSRAQEGDFATSYSSDSLMVVDFIDEIRGSTATLHSQVTTLDQFARVMKLFADVAALIHLIPEPHVKVFSYATFLVLNAAIIGTYGGSAAMSSVVAAGLPDKITVGVRGAYGDNGGASAGRLAFAADGAPSTMALRRFEAVEADAGLYRTLLASLEDAQTEYEGLVRPVLEAIARRDSTTAAAGYYALLAAEDPLSGAADKAMVPITAAASNANKTIAEFSSSADNVHSKAYEARCNRVLFHLEVGQWLAHPEDEEARQKALDFGYAAIASLKDATQQTVDVVTGLFTTPAYPVAVVSGVTLPDSVRLGETFEVSATIQNLGSGTARDVFAVLLPDSSFNVMSADSVSVDSLASGDFTSVVWEVAPYNFAVADTDSVGWGILTVMPGSSNGLYQSKTVYTHVYRDGLTEVGGPPEGPGRATGLFLRTAPNPFTTGANIRYVLPEQLDVEIAIYDVTGRLVKRLLKQRQSPGDQTARWDGTSAEGRRMPAGVYMCRVRAGGLVETGRMVLAR